MSIETDFFAASDIAFVQRCQKFYNEQSELTLYGLFSSLCLPIILCAVNNLNERYLNPLPKLNIRSHKIDPDSQIQQTIAKIARFCAPSFKLGKTVSKYALLCTSSYSIAALFGKMTRTFPYLYSGLECVMRTQQLQWLPSSKNTGSLVKMALGILGIQAGVTVLDSARRALFDPTSSLVETPKLNQNLQASIKSLIQANESARKHHQPFSHLLLWGPPGTGKTLLARHIAEQSQMDYMALSGSDFTQFVNRSIHVTELNKLFDTINAQTRPTVLFIDEAECILKNRDLTENLNYVELLHAFLKQVEKSSSQFVLILSTNRYQDIDPAVIDRVDFKLQIPLPAAEERQAILQNLIPQLFTEEEQELFFPPEKLDEIVKSTEGFSGRKLRKMIDFLKNMECTSVAMFEQFLSHYIENTKA